MKIYIFTITYNFDGDYIVKKCDTYKEAVYLLNEYLDEEIKVVQTECEYTPSVLRWAKDDVTLVYSEGYVIGTEDKNYATEDCANYRIFEVEI